MLDAARDSLPVYGVGPEATDAAPARDAADARLTFDQLYGAYIDRVHAYLKARAANQDDVADLTQQVFVKALAALPSYRGSPARIGPWVFRIAHHVLVDSCRRARPLISLELAPEAIAVPAPGSIEADAERLEIIRQVWAFVARLHAFQVRLPPRRHMPRMWCASSHLSARRLVRSSR